MNHKSFLQFTVLAMAMLPATFRAEEDSPNPGSVYTMDNASSGNNVLAFQRAADGALSPAGSFATGGTGTGGGLGNQGAVLLTHNARWLFACNAGSHEISVFAVRPDGLLLTDKVGSGGRRPVSLTLHRNLLYVLNAGGVVGDSDNITGFEFEAGKLVPISGSTRALSAASTGPAQISFTRDGEVLVVTEKATGIIDTFTTGEDGLVDGHKMFASPVPTPFGFAVGNGGHIFVSEANGGAANASSVGSFAVSDDGDLAAINSAVATMQSAACWVVLTRNEHFAYASNTGSGTISGYRVNADGTLQLLDANGITSTTGTGSTPIDLALTRDSRYLYSLNSGNGTISAFLVNANGSLQALPGLSGLPAGANGLAAR
jgi:6-phosphogluconolactonase (cycloisomerase 2 family)